MTDNTRTSRFVAWTLRHGRILWIVAVVLAIPATARTAWLYAHLKSDLEELLPRESPSVVALDELRARVGGLQYLGVVVDSGTKENLPAAERFLDDLAARVRTYPKELVNAVRLGNAEERAFVDKNGPLYLNLDDLETMRTRIRARRDYEVSKQTGALLEDEDEAPPPLDFKDIQSKYEGKHGAGGVHLQDRYVSEEKHLTVMLIELGGFSSGASVAHTLVNRVKDDVTALGGTDKYAPGMRLGYAGDAAIAVEELSALVADLSLSSVVVVIAVALAIAIYYRWWRSLFIVVPPLLLAAVYSFGVASLPPFGVQAVNSNTAFLGSIIVGNGINFGLILLARYVEERRAGFIVREALERAVAGARGGTLAAAAAAGVSYASLAVTQFRGFRQFGIIGGLGMFFAWGLAFVLMPPLIAWLDHGDGTRPGPKSERTALSYWVSRGVAKAPLFACAVTLVLTAVAAAEVARFRANDIETDFSRLRRRDTWEVGEGYWGARMNDVLGEYLTPFVFLTDSPEQARALETRLKAELDKPPFAGRIDTVRSIDDVVPRDQKAKLAVIDDMREDLTPNVRQGLTPEQKERVERFLDEGTKKPITLADVPRTFTLGMRERDGTADKIVLVSPSLEGEWWDANTMKDFVDGLRRVAREAVPEGRAPRLAGSVPLSSDIVQAIRRDGPIASVTAFVSVVAIVVFLLRRVRPILYVTVALFVGVLWLAGAARLFHVHINFANFIAFPITFGIGVDYAVNVVSRYEQEGRADILGAIRTTGAAVALCSLTTIIGYSSLLMAENNALFLFGLLAVLGEIACLSVALIGLPAFVLAFTRRPPRLSQVDASSSSAAHPTEGA